LNDADGCYRRAQLKELQADFLMGFFERLRVLKIVRIA